MHNRRRKQKLISKGYKFVDIERFDKLRNYDWNKQFAWNKTQTTEEISKCNNEILTVTKQTINNNNNLIDEINRSNRKRKLIYSPQNDISRNDNNHNSNNYSQSKKRRLI